MPLVVSRGNMYEWITHCHSHLRGGCPHDCVYCYVKSFRNYERDWTGPVRLVEKELRVDYYAPWRGMKVVDGKFSDVSHLDGTGKTIFIEHCSDLFAEGVPDECISRILTHTRMYPKNHYLFQSKNPARMVYWYQEMPCEILPANILGTTIETNRDVPRTPPFLTKAPDPRMRYEAMCELRQMVGKDDKLMVTIEPILQFDLNVLSEWIIDIKPDFINLGADSKRHNLPEPTREEVLALVDVLESNGVHINKKSNLERLL